ncbi:hypothetical protein [Pseudoalteromonas xiamenensis]
MSHDQNKIDPQKVTKPIQLLAAWLVGLIVVNTGFLAAAVKIGATHWTSGALVIAAIINVPLFLIAIFLLQTKFRPELQEDSYYSKYLDKKSNKYIATPTNTEKDSEILKRVELMQSSISSILDAQTKGNISTPSRWRGWRVSVNDFHENLTSIKRALSDAGIQIDDYFGSSSINPKPPKEFLIGFRESMDLGACIYLLRQVAGLGFTGYYYFDEPREMNPADVYLGPYGSPEDIIPINNELLELLNKENLNSVEIRSYESKYA